MSTLIPGQRLRLKSSMFIALTYHAEPQWLDLELHDGQLLRYLDVPPDLVQSMLDAESRGRYFHQHIRYQHPHQRLLDVGGRESWDAPPQRPGRAGGRR